MLKYCGWLRKPAPVHRWFIMVYPMILLGVQPSASSRGARFRWPFHPQYVEIPPKNTSRRVSLGPRGFCKCSRSVSAPVPPSPSKTLFQTDSDHVGWICDDQWVRLQMGYTMVYPAKKKRFFVPPCAICRLFRFALCMHVQDLTAKYWLHRSFAQPPCKSLQVSYCLVLDK